MSINGNHHIELISVKWKEEVSHHFYYLFLFYMYIIVIWTYCSYYNAFYIVSHVWGKKGNLFCTWLNCHSRLLSLSLFLSPSLFLSLCLSFSLAVSLWTSWRHKTHLLIDTFLFFFSFSTLCNWKKNDVHFSLYYQKITYKLNVVMV